MFCYCCGSTDFSKHEILWDDLIAEWNLQPEEVSYINHQQGTHCSQCKNNLRSNTLALGIMKFFGFEGLLKDFVINDRFSHLQVIELNTAGQLTQFLKLLPGHKLLTFPDFDMMQMQERDDSYDLIVHSDTLEHIKVPVLGLSECRRILKPGGACAYTIPMVVGRMSRSRHGLPPSYHGSSENPEDCLVQTEYGADAWRDPIRAGFGECRIVSLDHPAAHAFVAVK